MTNLGLQTKLLLRRSRYGVLSQMTQSGLHKLEMFGINKSVNGLPTARDVKSDDKLEPGVSDGTEPASAEIKKDGLRRHKLERSSIERSEKSLQTVKDQMSDGKLEPKCLRWHGAWHRSA